MTKRRCNADAGDGPIDADEFSRLFFEAFRPVWTVAYSILRDRGGADDMVQEAALIAWRRVDQYKPGTNFTAWFAQIVRFESMNQIRRAEHRRSSAVDPGILDAAMGGGEIPAPELEINKAGTLPETQKAFDDQVMAALGSLSEIARSCLLLRTIEGLEYREIAEILEIPPGTAMSHVHRTRTYLRERLAGMEADTVRQPSSGHRP